MGSVLEVSNIGKDYGMGSSAIAVLDGVSLRLDQGETAAIVGPSGSGKTTLLSLCAGLDRPSRGTITLLGQRLDRLTEDLRAQLRNRHVGFVFQSFHLMPSLTALENVMLPLELLGGGHPRQEALSLLDQVGLSHRLAHYPAQLSGGEQQRVSIARAFINTPKILFADEPTGNLDRETSDHITRLLFRMNRERETTLLLITHDHELADRTGRVFHLRAGTLSESPVPASI